MALKSKWTKALTSTSAPADSFAPERGYLHAYVYGTFVATAALERSYDGGTTWLPVEVTPGSAYTKTAAGSTVIFVPEAKGDVLYRWKLSAFTSGTVNAVLAQYDGLPAQT